MGNRSWCWVVLLVVYGTRPEYIKLSPVLAELSEKGIPHRRLLVGQHTDLLQGEYDVRLKVYTPGNRLDSICTSVLNKEELFTDISAVLVQGDTTTSMSVALAAFHRNIPVYHIEAGLRTFNIQCPYPEEVNRKIISALASLHFCPTEGDRDNLLKEGISESIIHVTGNTVIDNLLGRSSSSSDEVLVTMHRRENHDRMGDWFKEINALAGKNPHLTFTIPLHPNPNVQKHRHLLTHMNVCEPFSYDEMLDRLSSCKFVITDSGGLQEEASYFNKLCLVCRSVTERHSGSSILLETPEQFRDAFYNITKYPIKFGCPFGDGHASKRIVEIIRKNL